MGRRAENVRRGGPIRLVVLLALIAAAGCKARPAPGAGAAAPKIAPAELRPESTLHLPVTQVPKAKFPAVDFHQHTGDAHWMPDVSMPALIAGMDRHNVRALVILTGSWGKALQKVVDRTTKTYPGRFHVFTLIDWSRIDDDDFVSDTVAQLRDSVRRGARGLKILKELGLGVREKSGALVRVDDPRLDPIWAECGRLGIPVAIHTGDPEAFFRPVDAANERYDELAAHPEWSFHGKDFPTLPQLHEALERVFSRHPQTTFVSLHVGNWPENLAQVGRVLTRYPNVYVDLGARQAELGRQPRQARAFIIEHQDRVLFGTDAPVTEETAFGEAVYPNYFRWLETEDEYFDYYQSPQQGRWKIYGLGLPDAVLEKIYLRNAERVLAQFRGNAR